MIDQVADRNTPDRICCRKRKVNKKQHGDTANLLQQQTSYSGSTDSQPFLAPSNKPKKWDSGSDLAVSYVEVRSPYDDPPSLPRQPKMVL